MKTRFSLELALTADEQLRLFQVLQYLAERSDKKALIARELADYLAGSAGGENNPEARFENLIGSDTPGFDIVAVPKGARIFDTDGAPNLRMVCRIIANVVPHVLPFEFSFALLDDLDFHYRRALQPEGLSTVLTAVQAVEDAIKDARNAGLDPERGPAVTLLARHVGRLAAPDPTADTTADQPLRAQCLERIAELKSKPAIVALVRRGVDYDPDARKTFHREASRALRQIAFELGLTHDL